uniref:Aminopeptidase P N-terminal domain-containing protein n=1 Tax=Heliothis virescens TaxID=7102 RepID=A0A2A4K4X0_HELVI
MNQIRKLVTNITVNKDRRRLYRLPVLQNTHRQLSSFETPTQIENPPFSIPRGNLGQPTCYTHPHLISEEHLTCGITQAEFRERRETLIRNLAGETENAHRSHIIVIPAACKQYMSDKIPYVFRQNSDFFYLTGCLEPSAVLVMMKPPQTEEFKSILFVHDKDAHAELWEGPRTGCSAAARLFAVDEARPIENFGTFLNKLTTSSKPAVLWHQSDRSTGLWSDEIHSTIQSSLRGDTTLLQGDPQKTLHFMRVIKSPAEIELMKETCFIGSQSINMAMACTKPGMSEHMINAVLEYSCKQGGAEHLAFPPVCAGGPRATHIHYVANNQLLAENELLLSILFVHDKDAHAELWEGPRTGCSAAARLFAVDEARPIENFGTFLNKLTTSSKPAVLWHQSDRSTGLWSDEIHSTIQSSLRGDTTLLQGDPQKTLHFMRVIKSPAEIELMKETCFIGSQSINMAMACTKPGMSEHMINAVLEYSCKQGGAEHLAFPPVCAGGPRATHIHYVANNQLLAENELLLVDSGSQRWMYNSDISRTWPVSGKFTSHQQILYEIVLAVQKRLIEILGEQRPPLDKLFDCMCRLLGSYLQQEGILPHNVDGQELLGKAYRLCPHHVSHYLGMDVHDSSLVRRNVPVSTNMIVTVEPGIYISPDDTSVPPEFRGVGIRIEDDVLITDGHPLVLTDTCVKEVADIEALVGKNVA